MPKPFKSVEANASKEYLKGYQIQKDMAEPFSTHATIIKARVMAFCEDNQLLGSIIYKIYIEGKSRATIQMEPPHYPERTIERLHENALKAFYPFTFEEVSINAKSRAGDSIFRQ